MGTKQPVVHSEERLLHVQIMRAVARSFHDIPMVLKGGTALLLCYGLDRFSEDLDFDAPKKFNIRARVEKVLEQTTKAHSVRVVKDTETVQRLKVHYTGAVSDRLLKIETSFRTPPGPDHVIVIDGIRTYRVDALIEQKIHALENRTAARDLYDIAFLSRHHAEHFSANGLDKLVKLMTNVDAIEERFQQAFEDDEILDASDLLDILVQLAEFVHHKR